MREKLIELLNEAPTDYDGNRNVCVIADHLIANGVTVRAKGEWIKDEIISEYYGWYCSKCCTHFLERTAYCSWCGADMIPDAPKDGDT